ncbi:MAG TPA: hypothetical protein VIB48_24915 [Acidimicrobiia bacterium]
MTFPIVDYDFYRVVGNDSRRVSTFDNGGSLAARVPASTRSLAVTEHSTSASVVGLVASGLAALILGAVVVCRRLRRGRTRWLRWPRSWHRGERSSAGVAPGSG